MMKRYRFALLCLLFPLFLCAQKDLTYYLPDIEYDPAIPTPAEFLGWQIGEWHLSHDLQQHYMRRLAELSPRMVLVEYARSHEDRPLLNLIVTSEANHQNLEELKAQHRQISDGEAISDSEFENAPVVFYQGFSIHGNEPSGGNAAALVAYYLAAGQSPELEQLLSNAIILLDPCYNPDGFHRFSTWANMNKNAHLTSNPADREYNEPWPRGRTNHYWFDLNRDWLPTQHPESQGRMRVFQDWRPNVLTDHHEMGTNSTFFFMPGEQTRIHPLTPPMNQELTARIGTFHAAALDEIGSLYYTEEDYDDYYVGKGSTYPDLNGSVGILFEQASSRGHLQESANGLLSFPFTIRNQVTTALSSFAAIADLREDLLRYQNGFYQQDRGSGGYVFHHAGDEGRTREMIQLLQRHGIDVYRLGQSTTVDGMSFEEDNSYYVPADQRQSKLIAAMFDPITSFEDSLFYDVSTWTIPYAFNLPYRKVSAGQAANLRGATAEVTMMAPTVQKADYAYLIPWSDYYAGALAYDLLDAGVRVKVSHNPFTMADGQQFDRGTLLVQVANQKMNGEALYDLILNSSQATGVQVLSVETGFTPDGSDLGSRNFSTLVKPEIALIVGNGARSYDAGEAWHLLDQRMGIPITKLESSLITRADLDRYNVIVFSDGFYNSLSSAAAEQLRAWVRSGGVMILQEGANRWAASNGLAQLKFKSQPRDSGAADQRPYALYDRDRGGQVLGGSIFETEADVSHPLLYGMGTETVPVFRSGRLLVEPSNNAYATPLRYSDSPLLSGYVPRNFENELAGTAALVVNRLGSGRTISFVDNPNFRAFWFGTNRLFLNALFFGHTIDGGTAEAIAEE